VARSAQSAQFFLRILWLIAVVVVITGSILPGNSLPMRMLDSLRINDKVEHFCAYAVLALLPALHERARMIVAATVGVIALGIALEYIQRYSGWRDYEVADMVADTAGVWLGLAVGLPARSLKVVRSLFSTGATGG
jgi:VanZ family protein